jgi:hypothetical protein
MTLQAGNVYSLMTCLHSKNQFDADADLHVPATVQISSDNLSRPLPKLYLPASDTYIVMPGQYEYPTNSDSEFRFVTDFSSDDANATYSTSVITFVPDANHGPEDWDIDIPIYWNTGYAPEAVDLEHSVFSQVLPSQATFPSLSIEARAAQQSKSSFVADATGKITFPGGESLNAKAWRMKLDQKRADFLKRQSEKSVKPEPEPVEAPAWNVDNSIKPGGLLQPKKKGRLFPLRRDKSKENLVSGS